MPYSLAALEITFFAADSGCKDSACESLTRHHGECTTMDDRHMGTAHGFPASIPAPVAKRSHSQKNPASKGIASVPAQEGCLLQQLPGEMIQHIFGYLSYRDIKSVAKTCVYLRDGALYQHRLRAGAWFQQFEPWQQQHFTQIAKTISENDLKTWLGQYTRDETPLINLAKLTQSAETGADYHKILFYEVHQLMADCCAFEPVIESDIQCKTHYARTVKFSNDT
ncbi:F-box protein, partial [Endozoicomonas sp. ONNA2]|uniref:F-box protein n=1 Tax=Endozoicomonas sp. ONNA2 TaxID=2828741 RepID=UPI00214998CB